MEASHSFTEPFIEALLIMPRCQDHFHLASYSLCELEICMGHAGSKTQKRENAVSSTTGILRNWDPEQPTGTSGFIRKSNTKKTCLIKWILNLAGSLTHEGFSAFGLSRRDLYQSGLYVRGWFDCQSHQDLPEYRPTSRLVVFCCHVVPWPSRTSTLCWRVRLPHTSPCTQP